MEKIKQVFHNIGRDDINENMSNIYSNGDIDSFTIFDIVSEIENVCGVELPADALEPENFESFATIKAMVEKVKNS